MIVVSLVKEGAEAMTSYLQANYCPTVDDAPECEEHIAVYYPYMLVHFVFLNKELPEILHFRVHLSITILLMELCMFAKLWAFVRLEGEHCCDLRFETLCSF